MIKVCFKRTYTHGNRFHPMQITCGRCGIPDSAESTTPSVTTLPTTGPEQNPSSTPAAPESLPPMPSPPMPSSTVSPTATSVRSPGSPTTQNSNISGPGLGSSSVPSSSPLSPYTIPQAPADESSSLQASPKPLPSVPETAGLLSPPPAPSGSSTTPSLPAPANSNSQSPHAVAYGTPTAAPASPDLCADLQSDCTLICQQLNNDCSQPGGIGDYLR